MTNVQILHVLLGWLAQGYRNDRVPLGLLHRSMAGAMGVAPAQITLAAQLGQQRGLLTLQGRDAADTVVSLTDAGRDTGDALSRQLQAKVEVGVPTAAADAHIKKVVSEFERILMQTSETWARQASSDVEPIHVYLAAKSLAAGAFAQAIDALDAKRDKSGDALAEQRLLELLWKA